MTDMGFCETCHKDEKFAGRINVSDIHGSIDVRVCRECWKRSYLAIFGRPDGVHERIGRTIERLASMQRTAHLAEQCEHLQEEGERLQQQLKEKGKRKTGA